MASNSARWYQQLKEKDPAKYAEYLAKAKERNKKRRDELKHLKQSKTVTRQLNQELERQKELARERAKRCYWKKKEQEQRPSRSQRLSNATSIPRVRLMAMSADERKAHRNVIKKRSRERETPQRKRWRKQKDREYQRAKREKKRLDRLDVSIPRNRPMPLVSPPQTPSQTAASLSISLPSPTPVQSLSQTPVQTTLSVSPTSPVPPELPPLNSEMTSNSISTKAQVCSSSPNLTQSSPPHTPQKTPANKTIYNLVSTSRKKVIATTQSAEKYAQAMHLFLKTTPRKRQALENSGILVVKDSSKDKIKKKLEFLKKASLKGFFKSATNKMKCVLKTKARKKRKDAISIETVNNIKAFFIREDIARVLPGSRYATKKGQGYVLLHTLKVAHQIFCVENQHTRIGFSMFAKLRPKNVRKIGESGLESCLCFYCLNVRYKIHALNRLASILKFPDCRVQGELDFYNFLLCPKNVYNKFHAPECISRTCQKCHDIKSKVMRHYAPLLSYSGTVVWTSWIRTEVSGKFSRNLVTQSGTVTEMLNEFISRDILRPVQNCSFIDHMFVALWQNDQCRLLKKSIKEDEMLLIMDFAENKKAMFTSEIKSAHYSKRQITLHPVISFYRDHKKDIVRHSLIFLSDDISHDYHAVNKFTNTTLDFFAQLGIVNKNTKLHIFSDGAASQYKGKGNVADLGSSLYRFTRHYYGSEHGKNEADGETGVVSQAVRNAVSSGKLQYANAKQLHAWCDIHLTRAENGFRRTFFLIDRINRNRPESDIRPLSGIRKVHQIAQVKKGIVKSRRLSCFCFSCRYNIFELCKSIAYCGSFTEHKLKSAVTIKVAKKAISNTSREDFFSQAQSTLRSISKDGKGDFSQFMAVAKAIKEEAKAFPIIVWDPTFQALTSCAVDRVANNLLPEDAPVGRYPVITLGDGNCFVRSLSRAVFGDEAHHTELRVRIALEMAGNIDLFLNPKFVSRETDLDGDFILKKYACTGDFYDPQSNLVDMYRAETMAWVTPGTYAGMWQFHAAAYALETPIQSVYPCYGVFGQEQLRPMFHRCIPFGHFNEPKIFIMWSSMSGKYLEENQVWTANHFVPLLRISEQLREVEVVGSDHVADDDVMNEAFINDPGQENDQNRTNIFDLFEQEKC